jgi:hypothetical protein
MVGEAGPELVNVITIKNGTRRGMLFYSLLKKKHWREYLLSTLIEIGIMVVLLLSGAIIEWQMIQSVTGR